MDKIPWRNLLRSPMRWEPIREYVQAAGGNTSVKSPDGRTMAIKASGTALTLMSETDGWWKWTWRRCERPRTGPISPRSG